MIKRIIRTLKEWLKIIFIAFIIAILIKTFVIQSYTISSSTMEKTLYTGEYIFVNKLAYGARFPITLLSVPFTEDIYLEWLLIPYFRIPGFTKINRNDIIVFNYPEETDVPIDKKKQYLKRCIALPGDILEIKDKVVYVNDSAPDHGNNIQYNYRVITDGSEITRAMLEKYNITEGGIVAEIGIYDFAMTEQMADSLLKEPGIKYIRVLKKVRGESSIMYFPQTNYCTWNPDFFGPVIIPEKGAKANINHKNIGIYKRIIEIYEGNELFMNLNKILINGQEADSYTFKKNYYFVMDDNRDNSKDSRRWGFLPEDHIIGKASFTWFSVDKNKNGFSKVRWNRLFRKVS